MFLRGLSLIGLIFLFLGCSGVGLDKSDYQSRLIKVEMGMGKAAFAQIFPEAMPRGAKLYPQGTVEVLEVAYATYSFVPSGKRDVERNGLTGMEGQPQWFYFFNNKLVQYGNPNDWPKEPDLVVEKRLNVKVL